MTPAAAFDIAFGPDHIKADAIRDSVIRINWRTESADLLIGGEVYAVSPVYCEICELWEPDCAHIAAVKAVVADEIRAGHDDAADLLDTYRDALEVGIQ
jgi:hypothetical protein